MTVVWFSENSSWKMNKPTLPGDWLWTGDDQALKCNPSTYKDVWGGNSSWNIDHVKEYLNFRVSANSLCCWGFTFGVRGYFIYGNI